MRSRQVVVVAGLLVLCACLYLFVFGPYRNASYLRSQQEEHLQTTVPWLKESDGAIGTDVTYPHRPSSRQFFDPHGRDTLVFIHIPKTGGSDFLRHLVTLERDGEPLCSASSAQKQEKKGKKERAFCPRARGAQDDPDAKSGDPWLVAEKTIGWHCGLHPFYSEYRSCVASEAKRKVSIRKFDPTCRFHYLTMIRHPVLRYVSEYLHVQRGATFSYRHICNEHEVTDYEVPPCYPGFYDKSPWPNVTLPKFLSCSSNWGNNRQTLSIADLETVGCFDMRKFSQEERERRLLQSAKDNLKNNFAFFGITEYEVESGLLFERVFRMRFRNRTVQKPLSDLHSAPMLYSLWNSNTTYQSISRANHLDMELYEYALELFANRLQEIGIEMDWNRVNDEIARLLPDSGVSGRK